MPHALRFCPTQRVGEFRFNSIATQTGAIRHERCVTNIFFDRFLIIPIYCLWSVLRPGFTGAFSFPTQF